MNTPEALLELDFVLVNFPTMTSRIISFESTQVEDAKAMNLAQRKLLLIAAGFFFSFEEAEFFLDCPVDPLRSMVI